MLLFLHANMASLSPLFAVIISSVFVVVAVAPCHFVLFILIFIYFYFYDYFLCGALLSKCQNTLSKYKFWCLQSFVDTQPNSIAIGLIFLLLSLVYLIKLAFGNMKCKGKKEATTMLVHFFPQHFYIFLFFVCRENNKHICYLLQFCLVGSCLYQICVVVSFFSCAVSCAAFAVFSSFLLIRSFANSFRFGQNHLLAHTVFAMPSFLLAWIISTFPFSVCLCVCVFVVVPNSKC